MTTPDPATPAPPTPAFEHPRATLWRIDDPEHPVFFGYGTAIEAQLILVHPSQARGWTPRTARIRARLTTATTDEVLDGTLQAGVVRGLVTQRVVVPDGPFSLAEAPALDWPRRGHVASRDLFHAQVAAWAAEDPTGDPGPAPAEADAPRDPLPFFPQLVPPWCWLFPRCPGCR